MGGARERRRGQGQLKKGGEPMGKAAKGQGRARRGNELGEGQGQARVCGGKPRMKEAGRQEPAGERRGGVAE